MTAASPAASSPTSLAALLEARAPSRALANLLDGLAPEARLAAVLAVTGRDVGALYHAVADAAPLTIADMFPGLGTGTMILQGRNSLPAFSRFQKRFSRLEDGQIIGYNHQTMALVTGPGYFVVKPPSGDGPHPLEPYFDYTEAPPEAVIRAPLAGWPTYKTNDRGLSRLVYSGMKDYMRRVARGVIVGKAYVCGVDQKAYFSLTLA